MWSVTKSHRAEREERMGFLTEFTHVVIQARQTQILTRVCPHTQGYREDLSGSNVVVDVSGNF